MRLPQDWEKPLADGRLLILSCFQSAYRRPTVALAARRNRLVAALADEYRFIHIAPGSHTQRLAKEVSSWSPAVL